VLVNALLISGSQVRALLGSPEFSMTYSFHLRFEINPDPLIGGCMFCQNSSLHSPKRNNPYIWSIDF